MVATTSIFKSAFLNGVICTILRPAAKVMCILLNTVQCYLGPAMDGLEQRSISMEHRWDLGHENITS